MKNSGKMPVATLEVPVVVLMLAGAAFAAGNQETTDGTYTLTHIAGSPPPATSFEVKQGGDRIKCNGQTYQWNGVDRYNDVRGSGGDGYICIESDGGSGGFTYVPNSGTPSVCAY